MCRMIGMRSTAEYSIEPDLAASPHDLCHQSRCDRSGTDHPDGWGVGWYKSGRPVVHRQVASAFTDPRFNDAARQCVSTAAIAHVRKASVGSLALVNTHPFAIGQWLFAHNGTIDERFLSKLEQETDDDLKRAREGQTDSEHIVRWFLSRWRRQGHDLERAAPAEPLARELGAAVAQLARWHDGLTMERPLGLNLLLTSGRSMVCSRWGRTLSTLERNTDKGRVVLIASEPTSEEAWRTVPEGTVVWIDENVKLGSLNAHNA